MSDHPYRPTVQSQADLLEVWRHLMEPLGFGGHSIWMLRVGADRRAVPHLLEVTEADTVPDGPDDGPAFAAFLAGLDAEEPGGSFAFLRSRPGHGIDAVDRGWATFLYDAGRIGRVRMEVIHLATDTDLVPLPLDEVGVPRSA
jgi:hypothetical protein